MLISSEFDEIIESHGVPITLRRAQRCPCIGESGQPNIYCTICNEMPGFVWGQGVELIALVPGNQGGTIQGGVRNAQSEDYNEAGMSTDGSVILTFPTGVTVAHGDRVDLVNSFISINNERHLRGRKRGALELSTEVIRIKPVLEVEACSAIVNGQLVWYQFGSDFTIADDGEIVWQPNVIPDGTFYTLRYITRMSYICWSATSREEGGEIMPYRCLARRLDFIATPVDLS